MSFANAAGNRYPVEGVTGASLLELSGYHWEDLDTSSRTEKTFGEITRRAASGQRIATLISGPGSAETIRAAGLLARELGRELVRIKLSALGAKEIGETKTKLNKVFSSANPESFVLLFDEADSLFCKRADHDPQWEELTDCFMECMESFPGLTILATPRCRRIEPRLVRRLHFAVNV